MHLHKIHDTPLLKVNESELQNVHIFPPECRNKLLNKMANKYFENTKIPFILNPHLSTSHLIEHSRDQ
jgi:hypothetical protein